VPGTVSTGKIITALKYLGFDKVFDGGFFAAEAKGQIIREIEARTKNGQKLPLIAGCTPGCNKFIQDNYPDLSSHFWNGKSPEEIFGSLVKETLSAEAGKDPAKATSVSVSPYIGKKLEAQKPDGGIVLTVRELARMIKLAGIDLAALPETPFDVILGSGGTVVCAPSRGVDECMSHVPAQENSAVSDKGSSPLGERERCGRGEGSGGIQPLIVHGIANARKVLDSVRRGECDTVFVEILSCPEKKSDKG
jgi:NADH-quinone oxidoreductase subunit G/NADP-reducing hydrogenase subunit HndD